nr:VCBS repeat-containing protein [Rhodothermaceae bacterium]
DIIVVRKAPFMETEARTDLLLMNESGTLVDRTEDFAPGFAVEPTIARDAIITDLDGDGWDDVLIANTFGDQPKFYRNLGSDASGWLGLADESTTRLPTLDVGSIQYCGVAAGDVNGDGSPDLYFSNYVMDGTTKDVLLINDGNGTFTDEGDDRLGSLINVAFGTQGSITDMDGDGDNDIVKLSANQPADPFPTDGIFVLYNDGTGNFANWSEVPSTDAYMFIMEDFDNNGEKDFYIVDDGADYVNLSSGVTVNSNINFTQSTTPWARTASNGANLRVGDLDGDGDIDIGVADVDTSFPPCETPGDLRSFLLLENEGSHSGTFIDPFGAADKPWAVNMYDFAFVDVNKDGNLDIFSAQCNGYGLFTSTQEPVDPPPSGDYVVDGDFEAGPIVAETPGWQTYSEGEIIHDVWQVTDGTIDVHYYTMDGSGLGLQPEGGLQHIDLQGDNPGRVIQTIDELIAGQTYKLSFYYAAYPHSAVVGTAQAKVTIAGLEHTFTALTRGDESWTQYSGTFVASSTSEELAMEGFGSARQWGGVLIDLVDIISCADGGCEIAVPEVSSFSPASGYVGDAVTITGSNFTDAVSVSFAGTDAPIFTVVSDTEITATVPGGASTGAITVATASASGASSSDFEVVDSGSPNLMVAGDFEGEPLAEDGGWISYFEGETLYGVWEVVSGSVDIHHYLHASAGVPIYPDAGLHHIDLQGNEEGVMKQTVGGMTVGQKYRLSFIYAIYPYFAITEASANVQIGLDGNMLNESWTATNPGDEVWESGEFVFEATAASADVQFAGFGSARTWGGMLMDQIVLEACSDCTVGASPNMQLTEASSLDLQKELPEEFAIRDAFPNPFNDATDIVFGMPEAGYARMEIYNGVGQLIQVLIDGEQRQGYQRIRWEGDDSRGTPVASGVYLIRFEAGGHMQTRKVVVVR